VVGVDHDTAIDKPKLHEAVVTEALVLDILEGIPDVLGVLAAVVRESPPRPCVG
jgi:hypothetical protein